MTVVDTLPEPVRIRILAGATVALGLEVANDDGSPFDFTGFTLSSEIPGAPHVFTVTPTSISLDKGYSVNMVGVWQYTCWAESATERYCLARGVLEVCAS